MTETAISYSVWNILQLIYEHALHEQGMNPSLDKALICKDVYERQTKLLEQYDRMR